MIAVSFGPPTMAEALAGLPRIRAQAQCVELRLDLFEAPFDLAVLLRERGDLPAVVTLRPPHQGGRSPLSPPARLAVLLEAADGGAEYVDLESDAATPEAVAALQAAGARVIVSRHDFAAMPADLADGWWPALAVLGADVVKIVGTARSVADTLQVFRAFARADRPTIAIAMGEAGLLTRILALREPWCLLTYAALGPGAGHGPRPASSAWTRCRRSIESIGCALARGCTGCWVDTRSPRGWRSTTPGSPQTAGTAWPSRSTSVRRVPLAPMVAAFRELPVSGWHVHGREFLQTACWQRWTSWRRRPPGSSGPMRSRACPTARWLAMGSSRRARSTTCGWPASRSDRHPAGRGPCPGGSAGAGVAARAVRRVR